MLDKINRFIDLHKKTHYQCIMCGLIIAPYFSKEFSLKDYGCHKAKNMWNKNTILCRVCSKHGFRTIQDWDNWQKCVETSNEKIKTQIKEKDPIYYDKFFD